MNQYLKQLSKVD